jgi:hypothetical protein
MLLTAVGLAVAAAYQRPPQIFFAPEHAGHGANGPERPQRLDDICVRRPTKDAPPPGLPERRR